MDFRLAGVFCMDQPNATVDRSQCSIGVYRRASAAHGLDVEWNRGFHDR
jgi:hypothetical protein